MLMNQSQKLTPSGTSKHLHTNLCPTKSDKPEVRQLNTPKDALNKKSTLKRAYDEITANPDLDLLVLFVYPNG
jgi:hypothetical protein